jgi:hypothetical protein
VAKRKRRGGRDAKQNFSKIEGMFKKFKKVQGCKLLFFDLASNVKLES